MGGDDGQRQPEEQPLDEAQLLAGLLPQHPDRDQVGPRPDERGDGGEQDHGGEEERQHDDEAGPLPQRGGQRQEHR